MPRLAVVLLVALLLLVVVAGATLRVEKRCDSTSGTSYVDPFCGSLWG